MTRLLALVAIICIIFTCLLALAEEKPVPWTLIDGADQLNDEQKKVAELVLKSAMCYAACADTIAQCLADMPKEAGVLRQAAFIVRRAKVHKDPQKIKEDLRNRALSAYPPRTHTPDLQGLTPSGAATAKIKVVAYGDFECPYCRIAIPALRQMSKDKPELIAFYFKNFPLKSHKYGLPCSRALLAADRQGKFWEMLDLMYASANFSDEAFMTYAKLLDMAPLRFKKDYEDNGLLSRIRKEKEEGQAFGVKGTPGVFINGKHYKGAKTFKELLDRIEEEKDILESRQ